MALGNDHAFVSSGGDVLVFERSGAAWIERTRLEDRLHDGNAERLVSSVRGFSSDVAVDRYRGRAVIGASRSRVGGVYGGSAHYFNEFGSNDWIHLADLVPSDPEEDAYFGRSVAIDNYVAVVGAMFKNEGSNQSAGAAYVFRRSNSNPWPQEQKLTCPDGTGCDHFGFSLDVSGDVIVVAASEYPGGSRTSGAAYVFRYSEGEWGYEVTLTSPYPEQGDEFGGDANQTRGVATSGDVVAVGAFGADPGGTTDAGAVYVYRYDSAGPTWTLEAEVTAPDGQEYDHFGRVGGAP